MRRFILGAVSAAGCLFMSEASGWVDSPCCYYDWNIISDVELLTGYRHDNLHWSIADPSGTPNTLSEFRWKDVQIWEAKAQARLLLIDLIYLRASADYGHIFHGKQQNSTYAGDDKTLETYLTTAKSNYGEVFDFSGGVGWQLGFCLCGAELRVIPLIGYSYSEQHFLDRDGEILVNAAFSALGNEIPLGPLGAVDGLHSNYRGKWRGAWAGVDLFFPICGNLELQGSFEYHRLKYHGTAHWNLRTDLVSDIEQKAKKGHGIYASSGFKYRLCGNSFIGLTGSYRWMKSQHGTQTNFFVLAPETTSFNGATWQSWSVLADVGIAF